MNIKKLYFVFFIPFFSCVTVNKYYPTIEQQGLNITPNITTNKGSENCKACGHLGCLVFGCTYNPEHTCELLKNFYTKK